MDKYSYFVYAYKTGIIKTRRWMLRVFSAPMPTKKIKRVEGEFFYDTDGAASYYNDKLEPVRISDHKKDTPLYGVKEPVVAKKGDFAIADKDYKTFYSNLFLNVFLFDLPYGGKIPFHNGTFTGDLIDARNAKALKNRTITIDEYRVFTKAMSMIAALGSVITPSATYKAVVPPKDMVAFRTRLLKEYDGQLDDPVVIAKIEQALVDHYKEYIKGDPAEGYYIDKKGLNVALKRSSMMFGGEPRLDDTTKMNLNVKSLLEGLDMRHLPDMINSLRMGSYARGKETALGGEGAKFSARVFQNTRLVEEDCGSVVGVPFPITIYNVDTFNSRYRLVNGKAKIIKPGDLKPFIGKTVIIRSPMTCWTPNGNYCPVCMGKEIADSGIGIGVMASAVSSVLMNVFMSKMHGRVLEHAAYDIDQSIQ